MGGRGGSWLGDVTLFVFGQAEVAVPAGHQNHVVGQVFSLDLQLLHHDDVGLEDVEHGMEGALLAPWLVAKGVTDPVDVPGGDAHGATRASWRCLSIRPLV